MTNKTHSVREGAKTMSEIIHTVKCINRTLLKGCDRLTGRMSLQEGNMHAIEIMSKDETLSLLYRLHTLKSLMRALKQNTGQEIQTLQKAMIKRFINIEKFIKFVDQGQKVQGQTSVRTKLRYSLPTVLPVFFSDIIRKSI